MRALPDVWVHRRPNGASWGPLDDKAPAPAAAGGTARRTTFLHVLGVLTRNEFRARYRAQALGILWSLLNPLVQMVIMSLAHGVPAVATSMAIEGMTSSDIARLNLRPA